MFYCGLDIAKAAHRAVVLDNEGEKASKFISFDNTAQGYDKFLEYLLTVAATAQNIKIGLEATGNHWENIYSFLTQKGVTVIVLNPYQTNKYRQALMKKAKTDDIDALVIAGLIRSQEYSASFIPQEQIQFLREITKLRYHLVKDIKDYQHQLMALLSLVFPEYESTSLKNPFFVSSITILKGYPTAKHLASAKVGNLQKIVRHIQGSNFSAAGIEGIIVTAKNSVFSGRSAEARGKNIVILLNIIEQIQSSIKKLNEEIDSILSPPKDSNDGFPGENLLTIPGVGKKTVAAFLSVVGDNGATFSSTTKLLGHIGFFPKIFESGTMKQENTIAKRGPKYIRWALYSAAVASIKHNTHLRTIFHRKVSQGKTAKQAIICVAKKLACMMLSMLKSGAAYDPARVFVEA